MCALLIVSFLHTHVLHPVFDAGHTIVKSIKHCLVLSVPHGFSLSRGWLLSVLSGD